MASLPVGRDETHHRHGSIDPSLPAWERWIQRHLPRVRTWILVLLVLGIATRAVRYALNFPLWGDEAFVAVNFLSRGFRDMAGALLYGQIVPAGFMWANLAVTRVAGLSEYALRLLPFAASVVALLLFWRFARVLFNRRITLAAVGFLAPAYYTIRHANEVKAYSTDLLLSLGLMMLAWSTLHRPSCRKRWALLVVYAVVGVWCSYPLVFVVGAVVLLFLHAGWRERSRALLTRGLTIGLAGSISWIAMYVTIARPQAVAAAGLTELSMWTLAFPPITELWKLPLWLIWIHAGNMMAYPVGGHNGGSIATLVCVVIGAIAVGRSRHRALLWLFLAPLGLNLVAAAAQKYPYGGTARTSLYMAPAFCLLAGVGLTVLLRRVVPTSRSRFAVPIFALVFACIAIGEMVRDVVEPFKKDANYAARRVVRELAAHVKPNDQVVVFNALEADKPYAPYIAPWRGDGAQFIFYMTCYLPTDPIWAPPPEAVTPLKNHTTWFVAYEGVEFRLKHDKMREIDPAYGATHPPLADMLTAYRRVLDTKLGPPIEHRHDLQDKHGYERFQAMDIYEYPPP